MMPEARENSQKHIAVFTFPFATHAAPLLSLVRKLSESTPDVKFYFFSTAKSNRLLFYKDDDFERVKPRSINTGLPEGYMPTRSNGSLFYKDDDFERVKPRSVNTGLPEGYMPTRVLPQEPVEYFLKTTPGNFKRAPLIDWFVLFHCTGLEEQTVDFLPGFSTIRAMDVPEGIISRSLDCPFATLMNKMGQMLPYASAIAINSFEEIDPIVVQTLKSRLSNFLNIGPFILRSPPTSDSDIYGIFDWLDQRPRSSVVYISFGNVITPPPHELEALAEALKACKFPFLLSFRGNVEEKFPKGFLERTRKKGLIVPWAPQLKIMAHPSVAVFVTHCGWNSVSESIIGGVPMICRPYFAEQKLNQRTVEHVWGFGIEVEGGKFTKNGAIKALQVILSSKKGKLMRKKIGVLKQLAFKAIDTDGSSTTNFNFLVDFISKR
ncbi:hypothetical protein EZV62_012378 [Acer yangbiense]|uniref:Glycosyltransferase n=1 Tax=Acer yangbiense TaxID=1000413 RepID=A0A5C7HW47_9ROSI|nr:hypothetical protein EZV62_012378 [Acer yangbiense]